MRIFIVTSARKKGVYVCDSWEGKKKREDVGYREREMINSKGVHSQ